MASWMFLSWPSADQAPDGRAKAWAGALSAAGWSKRVGAPHWEIWTRQGSPPIQVLPASGALIVGDLFRRPGGTGDLARLLGELPCASEAAARCLAGGAWGRYVAILGLPGDAPAVFRDPSGMLEAFAWRLRDGTGVIADGVRGLPPGLAPPDLSIDWTRLALGLAEPVAAIAEPPLAGFHTVGAGMLQPLDPSAAALPIWRPSLFAADPGFGPGEAARTLADRIDHCTAVLLSGHDRCIGEVSGGLDSAIVASAAVSAPPADASVTWLNVWSSLGGADERRYARAVASRLGLELRELELLPAPLEDDDYEGLLDAVRPPLTAASREYDRAVHDLASRTSATGLLTGEGGDAVLFQSPTPLVAADLLAARGPAAILSPELAAHARWTRRSVWSLAAAAMQALSRGPRFPASRIALPGGVQTAASWRHPWMQELSGLPPGKQLHVLGVTNAQAHTAGSRRRLLVEPVNPLLAQPVVELCLSLPTPLLTLGGRDRGLARRAFADRLPAQVAQRRSKGDMALFYGAVVTRSLPWLRDHLMGGCLAEAEVIDREALSAALTPERLAQAGGASAILSAALTETWVRHWQRRVPDTPGAVRGPHVQGRPALA